MDDWKTVCRFCGVLIAIPAALFALLDWYFLRIDGLDDYESTLNTSVIVGGLLAFAFVLFCAPRMHGATKRRYALVATVAVLIWVAVSGSLVWNLEEYVRIRSTPTERMQQPR